MRKPNEKKISFRQCLREGLVLMAMAHNPSLGDLRLIEQMKDEL